MRRYIVANIDKFNKFQLIKLLDIYKFNVNFLASQSNQVASSTEKGTTKAPGNGAGVRLKQLLETQLEAKQFEKLNDSEEEELKNLSSNGNSIV